MIRVFINSILPLFSIIILGYFLKKKEIITKQWETISNKIVYNIALPALLIKALSKADIKEVFSLKIIISVVVPISTVIFLALIISKYLFEPKDYRKSTFVHSSFHGNIGYMAYAVGFYALNSSNFHYLVVISSILIIFQNIMPIIVLTLFSNSFDLKKMSVMIVRTILKNPVILAVIGGCILSIFKIDIPVPLKRFINIIASMALPTALLLIGAGLIFKDINSMLKYILIISTFKLVLLPITGLIVLKGMGLDIKFILPLLILLASPTAVLTYILSTEIGGSPNLAASNISVQTLLCAMIIASFGVH